MKRNIALLALLAAACNEAFADRMRHRGRARARPQLSADAFSNTKSTGMDGSTEWMEAGDMATFDGATNVTWSFWVKPDTTNSNNTYISKDGGGGHRQFTFRGNTATPVGQVRFFINSTLSSTAERWTSDTGWLVSNVWQHIFVLYDGGGATNSDKLRIFKNCIEATDEGTFDGTIPTAIPSGGDGDLQIGSVNGSTGLLDGNIDEVAIYVGSLETCANFHDGELPLEPPGSPSFYYKMGDGDTSPTVTNHGSVASADMNTTNMDASNFEDDPASLEWADAFSVDFDGSTEYAHAGDVSNFNSATSATWSFWADPTADLSSTRTFMAKSNVNDRHWTIRGESVSGTRAMRIIIADSETTQNAYWISADDICTTAGGWCHFCVQYDGSGAANADRLKTFKNGSEITSAGAFTGTIPATMVSDSDDNFEVGARAGGSGNFAGFLDEISVYVGSIESCVDLYNSGSTFDQTDDSPTFYWWMGDFDTIPYARDHGTAGVDLLLVNMDQTNFDGNTP